jgi:hypothetical protein
MLYLRWGLIIAANQLIFKINHFWIKKVLPCLFVRGYGNCRKDSASNIVNSWHNVDYGNAWHC